MITISNEMLLLICAVASCVAAILALVVFIRSFVKPNKESEERLLNELARLRAEQTELERDQRVEMANSFSQFQGGVQGSVRQLGDFQKERLEQVTREMQNLGQRLNDSQLQIRETLEKRLDVMRHDSMAKLEDMRKTVDEKLQTTLEKRLSESFAQVREQLDRVHKGLGEMQALAIGVGDLKKVLTNVKTRGVWGEMQLGNLLEQFLVAEQYIMNAQVKAGSAERVEFAVRFPGRDGEGDVLLPIDAKFPQEDFERLVTASEEGNSDAVKQISQQLEDRVRSFGKSIADKYINPPLTTDFAILFLPTESLYAEMIRRPGLFEKLQRDYHVTLAGPTTLTALLNALQMGFRSVAIEKRSSEVWKVLGAVRAEFTKYGDTVEKLKAQLNTAVKTIDTLGTRTRVMGKKLDKVDHLPESEVPSLLGLPDLIHYEEDEEMDERSVVNE